MAPQRVQHGRFERQSNSRKMSRMLGFRIHAHRPIGPAAIGAAHQLHDLIEGGHAETAVKTAVLRPQIRQALARAQTLDFRQRKVLGEPPGHGFTVDDLRTAARRKLRMLRNVRRAADLILMPRDQYPIARHDEVRLDEIRALLNRQTIRFEGVFRPLAAGATMCNYNDFIQRSPAHLSIDSSARTQGPRLHYHGASSPSNPGPPYRGGVNSDWSGSCADIRLAVPGLHGISCCPKPPPQSARNDVG